MLSQSLSSLSYWGALDKRGFWRADGGHDHHLTLGAAHVLGRLEGPILELFSEDGTEALTEFLQVRGLRIDKKVTLGSRVCRTRAPVSKSSRPVFLAMTMSASD